MSLHGRNQRGESGENIPDKVRKMKQKQKQWMQEREVAKVSEPKSVSTSKQSKSGKQRMSPALDPDKSNCSLTWISKDDYQSSVKRSGTKNTTPRRESPQTKNRRLTSTRESGYGSSQIKREDTERSRGSRRSETSITGFDEGEQKSTRDTINSSSSPDNHVKYGEHISDIQNNYLTNNLSSESFNTLADKIAERLQVKEKSSETKETIIVDINKSDKPMSNHICSECETLMAPPQHSPIALIPCGHTFCQLCVSEYSKCPQCRTEVFSTAPNTVMQQIIEGFGKKQEKERLKQLEDQTRKYVEEYQNLNLRCEGLADEADRILNSMESMTEEILEEKRVAKKLEKENHEIKNKMKELELEFHQNEELIKASSSNCHSLEHHYDEEKDKLTLIEETIKTIRNSKERAKIMIQNLAPNLKIDDSFDKN